MSKRFDTLIDIYDHILPTWSKWDLLAEAPAEQCKALNVEGASRYRLSDGKHVVDVWVTWDVEGIYQRAPIELEIEFNNFHIDSPMVQPPMGAVAPTRMDERALSAKHTPLHSQQLNRTKPGKPPHRQASRVDARFQHVP